MRTRTLVTARCWVKTSRLGCSDLIFYNAERNFVLQHVLVSGTFLHLHIWRRSYHFTILILLAAYGARVHG